MYLVRVSPSRRPWPKLADRFPRLGDRLFVAALALSVCSVLAGASLAPGVARLAEALGAADSLWVRLLVSIPALGVPVGALLFARLSAPGRDRLILQGSIAVFAFCGALGALEPGAGAMLAARFLQGVAIGPIMLTALRLLNAGADPRADLGAQAGVMTGSTVLILILGGAAGALAWQAPFLLNLAPLALLPVVAGLSDAELAARRPASAPASAPAAAPSALLPTAALLAFLAMACFYAVPARMADFLLLQGVTNPLAVSGAIIVAVLAAAAGGLAYRRYGASAPATLTLAFAAMFVGGFQVAHATSMPALGLGAALIGLGFGAAFPALNHAAGSGALGSAPEKASAIIVAAFHVGQFASPVASAGGAGVAAQLGGQALFLPYAALALGGLALIVANRRDLARMGARDAASGSDGATAARPDPAREPIPEPVSGEAAVPPARAARGRARMAAVA